MSFSSGGNNKKPPLSGFAVFTPDPDPNLFVFSAYSNDFSKMVAEEYLTFFEFTGMTLDQSLRYTLPHYNSSAVL